MWRNLSAALLIFASLLLQDSAHPAAAEPSIITVTRLPGLPHLPMIIMQEEKLIEKHLKSANLGAIEVNWAVLNGAAQVDALISGRADITDFGLTNLATAWAATNGRVKAISGISSVPSYLITNNPNFKTLRDIQPSDRIGIPSIAVSPQAIWLKMAAKKEFGDSKYLDRYTVAISAPDATVALLVKSGGITTHFSIPPYQEQALKDSGIQKITSSTDIMGAVSTQVVMSATVRFHDENPKIVAAALAAAKDAMAIIKDDPNRAADIYLRSTNDSKTSKSDISNLFKDQEFVYDTKPINVAPFIGFMEEIGQLRRKPTSWKDLFFEDALK